jgi:hypothetical protein
MKCERAIMYFKLNIDCGNAAFCDADYPTYQSAAPELARILRKIADDIENGAQYDFFQTIHDVNGNDVGRYAIKHDK